LKTGPHTYSTIGSRNLATQRGGKHKERSMREITLDAYKAMVGQEIGVSRWFEVNQDRIDQFADVTEDHQFIHVDPERAKASPFGGTVAHGFLTLSLLAPMAFDPACTGSTWASALMRNVRSPLSIV
jgi:acyl dehydratase